MWRTGTCRFCGQTSMTEAKSPAAADAEATANCSCDEGKRFREKEKCLNRISEICQAPREEAGVNPLTVDEASFIRGVADRIAMRAIDGATIDIKGTVIKLRPGDEKKPVKFSRSWRLEIEN